MGAPDLFRHFATNTSALRNGQKTLGSAHHVHLNTIHLAPESECLNIQIRPASAGPARNGRFLSRLTGAPAQDRKHASHRMNASRKGTGVFPAEGLGRFSHHPTSWPARLHTAQAGPQDANCPAQFTSLRPNLGSSFLLPPLQRALLLTGDWEEHTDIAPHLRPHAPAHTGLYTRADKCESRCRSRAERISGRGRPITPAKRPCWSDSLLLDSFIQLCG